MNLLSAFAFPIGCVVHWILLLIVVPIAQKLADFALPPWRETMLTLGVVAVLVNALVVGLDMVNVWVSLIGAAVLFWTLMVKWFEVDFLGAFIIMVVARLVWLLLAFVALIPKSW